MILKLMKFGIYIFNVNQFSSLLSSMWHNLNVQKNRGFLNLNKLKHDLKNSIT